MQPGTELATAVAYARRPRMERRRSVQVESLGDACAMKTTKPAEKKPVGDKRKPRKPYYLLPRYPMYPESYVHVKGPSSTWRSNERNV
jgi:hypothetical protein